MKWIRRDRSPGRALLNELVREHRHPMLLLAATSLMGGLVEAGFLVLLTGVALALVAGSEQVGPLAGFSLSLSEALLVAAFAVVARLLLNFAVVYTSASMARAVTLRQRERLAVAYTRTSWTVQQSEASGRLQALMVNYVGAMTAAVAALAAALSAALSLTAFMATGLVIDLFATLAVAASLLVLGVILGPVRRRIRLRSGTAARRGLDFAGGVAELAALGLEMHVFGVQSRLASRLAKLTRDEARASFKSRLLSGALTPLYTFLAYSAVVALIAALVVWGGIDNKVSAIGAVMLLMIRSLGYGQQLQAASGALAANLPYLDQVVVTLRRYEESAIGQGDRVPGHVTPIDFDAVNFSYTGERPALSGMSLTINHGEVVGIIGPSGAGKSTLAQLLLGLREPSQGRISVNGVDLREVGRRWWTKRVAFVAQDALLFTGTVAENIRFFRDGISDEDVRNAARRANVLRDIECLPQGFDTHLGERGSQLSGGQRQRMSIARALAGRPELLILDEPTSALDGTSEALIRSTLADLKGDVTVVIIAHRISTLDICDRIAVIEAGRMTGIGSPGELRETSEYYRNALAVAGIS